MGHSKALRWKNFKGVVIENKGTKMLNIIFFKDLNNREVEVREQKMRWIVTDESVLAELGDRNQLKSPMIYTG